jgi:hypothetical protein
MGGTGMNGDLRRVMFEVLVHVPFAGTRGGARTETEAGNRRGISTEWVSGWIDINYEVGWRSNSVFYNPSKEANEYISEYSRM